MLAAIDRELVACQRELGTLLGGQIEALSADQLRAIATYIKACMIRHAPEGSWWDFKSNIWTFYNKNGNVQARITIHADHISVEKYTPDLVRVNTFDLSEMRIAVSYIKALEMGTAQNNLWWKK